MSRRDETRVDATRSLYTRHRLPSEIVGPCAWRYYLYTLSLRDVAELMLTRGNIVSHETICSWCAKFGPGSWTAIQATPFHEVPTPTKPASAGIAGSNYSPDTSTRQVVSSCLNRT